MTLYGVKTVPDVTVKYILRNGEQEVVVFDGVKYYNVCTDPGVITMRFMCANDDFFIKFKKALLDNQIIGCILNATGIRRSSETAKDEEYCELKDLYCGAPSLSYHFSCEGDPANFILQFPIH